MVHAMGAYFCITTVGVDTLQLTPYGLSTLG